MTSSLIAQSLWTRNSWADPISDLLEDVSLFEDAVFADPDRWWLLLAIPLGAAAAAYGRRARRRAAPRTCARAARGTPASAATGRRPRSRGRRDERRARLQGDGAPGEGIVGWRGRAVMTKNPWRYK